VQVLRIVDPGSDEAAQMREIIDRQARHMTRMIDDLLEVSRISRGKIQIRREPVDLARIVRDTVADLRPTLHSSRMELDFHVPDDPVPVVADPTRIAQVLTNLLQNAVKFSNPGGQVTVRLDVPEGSRMAVVSVRDTGIGLSAKMLEHVFEPFSQADSSLDRSRGGMGLGLALVKGLVELHGGRVTASSAGEGKGAEFRFSIELASRDQLLSQDERPKTAPPSPRRILIVDDQRDASLPMRTLLELDGHEARIAVTGAQGLNLAREWRPDVVLCDIGLPGGMSGYDVAEALRADEATRDALLVAVTGYGQEEDRRQASAAGFDRHMTKPVGQSDLRALLNDLLTSRK
jgi:CheY-like chemotaxis protein/two-component sensor histidine kinase